MNDRTNGMDEQLIIRYITGKCTSEESLQLERWIVEDKANADSFFEAERIWSLKDEEGFRRAGEADRAFRRLQKKLHAGDGKQTDRRWLFLKYAAAIVIIALLAVNLYYQKHPGVVAMNTVEVPEGQSVNLVLSDGTRVCLNAKSSLHYPASFSGKRRSVELVGEAYFEVTPDEKSPFTVTVPAMSIHVLGTTFNVKAYRGETTYVTLSAGKVEVVTADNTSRLTLKPNEQASYSESAGLRLVRVKGDAAYAWTNGELAYVDKPLAEIVLDLERRFNTAIHIDNPSLGQEKFSCRVKNKATLEQILTLLKTTRRLDFRIENESIRIFKNKLPME